jgi:hypothetical protein
MSLFALSRITVGAAAPDGSQHLAPEAPRIGDVAPAVQRHNAVANAEASVLDLNFLIVTPLS